MTASVRWCVSVCRGAGNEESNVPGGDHGCPHRRARSALFLTCCRRSTGRYWWVDRCAREPEPMETDGERVSFTRVAAPVVDAGKPRLSCIRSMSTAIRFRRPCFSSADAPSRMMRGGPPMISPPTDRTVPTLGRTAGVPARDVDRVPEAPGPELVSVRCAGGRGNVALAQGIVPVPYPS